MIYPEDDEFSTISNYYTVDYPYNITSIQYRSPTLPLHFDKSYLPRNLCEKEIIHASECLLLYNTHKSTQDKMCNLELSKFQSCRRQRDLRILNSIKDWETLHITKLDKTNRGMYMMGLGRKLARLEQDYGRQTSSIKGVVKLKELQIEMKELKWRLDYIKKLETTLE